MTEYLGMRWLGQREMEGAGESGVYEKGAEGSGCQRRERRSTLEGPDRDGTRTLCVEFRKSGVGGVVGSQG